MDSALSLSLLKKGDAESVRRFQKHMAEDGWAFVELDEALVSLISSTSSDLTNFFENTPQEKKFQHSTNLVGGKQTDGPVYGYNSDPPRKQGLRLLTNQRLSPEWIPKTCPSLVPLTNALHQNMLQLVTSISPHLFGTTAEQLGAEWNVPLLRSNDHPKTHLKAPGGGQFGMLDAAYYFNKKEFTLVNCEEHTDPGLLSLSVLSTQPGLQLKKMSGKKEWVDAPAGVGQRFAVIWGGKLIQSITDGQLKAGIHRVINIPDSPPRMSLWLECVTETQDLALTAPLLMQLRADVNVEKTQLDAMARNSKRTGVPMSKKIPPSQLDVMAKHSQRSGVPMSKSGGLTRRPLPPHEDNQPTRLDAMMIDAEITGIPMSKSAPPPQYQSGPEPTRLDTMMIDAEVTGIPMSKSEPPPDFDFPIELNNQPTHENNRRNYVNNPRNYVNNQPTHANNQPTMLDAMMMKSQRSGVPMSKSGRPRPPPTQPTPAKKQATLLDAMMTNSHQSGVPMSKSAPPPMPIDATRLDSLAMDSRQTGVPMSKMGDLSSVMPKKTPINGLPGQYKKLSSVAQYSEMQEHVKSCTHKTCFSVWNGMWGAFIGGRDGDVNFALTQCKKGRRLNEQIGWDYANPSG